MEVVGKRRVTIGRQVVAAVLKQGRRMGGTGPSRSRRERSQDCCPRVAGATGLAVLLRGRPLSRPLPLHVRMITVRVP